MADMNLRQDVSLSLHQRILKDIEENILTGRWPPGYKIPSEQALTEQYACSRMTVNKVVTQLARAGLVLRRRKTGSIVMPQNSQSAILEIYDIRHEVEALGLSYRFEIRLRIARQPTKTEQGDLSVSPKRRLLQLTCLHHAGNEPFCLEERIINLSAVPEAEQEPFDKLAPGPWLLQHVPWSAAEHRIAADAADETAAACLSIATGSPVLVVQRQTWRLDEAVTRVRLTYPGAQHALTARFTPSQNINSIGG